MNLAAPHTSALRENALPQESAAEKFRVIATRYPKTNRFVLEEKSSEILSTPVSFFSSTLQLITGTAPSEISANQKIIQQFHHDLIKQFGHKVTAFAFPSLEKRLSQGTPLDSPTITQTFEKAFLFQKILSLCKDVSFKAVAAKEEARSARSLVQKAATLCYDYYEAAAEAATNRDAAEQEIMTSIDAHCRLLEQKTDTSSPKNQTRIKAFQELKSLSRAISTFDKKERGPLPELELFESMISLDPEAGDRLVLNEDLSFVLAVPRPWTGKAFQWIRGRETTEMEENRRTITALKEALTAKYGSLVAHIAFPTASERLQKGSRLTSATLQTILQEAKEASSSDFFLALHSTVEKTLALSQKAFVLDRRYRSALKNLDTLAKEANQQQDLATQAYQEAEDHLLLELGSHNVPVKEASSFLDLWFEEARDVYKKEKIPQIAPLNSLSQKAETSLFPQEKKALSSSKDASPRFRAPTGSNKKEALPSFLGEIQTFVADFEKSEWNTLLKDIVTWIEHH